MAELVRVDEFSPPVISFDRLRMLFEKAGDYALVGATPCGCP
ncbi:MAG: hypothetical protein Q8J64_00295 [Thermodesulfovibrionales bacterium]|nr:hypothetical protein [Thermodesulfovibrionales bacterium]